MQIQNDEFGKHLIIDLTITPINRDNLIDIELGTMYMDEITKICGMQQVIPTISMKFPFSGELCGLVNKLDAEGVKSETLEEYKKYVKSKEDNDTGVSSFSIWNTSHCSYHSWSEECYASIDLYSCLNFETEPVLDFTRKFFNAKEMRIVEILRHTSKPQEIKQWSE